MTVTSDSPWLLALDASTSHSVLVLGRRREGADAALLTDVHDDRAGSASTRLHERIAALLVAAGLDDARALGTLACGRGPGTFTGTRVAVATAKGLALGLDLGVVPCSTLAAIAATHDTDDEVLAVMDARRGDVYAARYRLHGGLPHALTEECCVAAAELAPLSEGVAIAAGPGLVAATAGLPDTLPRLSVAGPSPRGLWRAALAAGAPRPAGELQAVYLRESYAELGLNTPRRPPFRNPLLPPADTGST